MKYSITIQYDEGDKIYVASVPELKGCMAHGKTPGEAAREIETAMELWIEDAEEAGERMPEPSYMPAASGK